MKEPLITAEEFEKRLTALCLSGVTHNLPKKQRDRHILFRSVTHTLDPARQYSEPELNAALGRWLLQVGIGVDHVTLRRHLVDERYLVRDRQGSIYEVFLEGRGEAEFEPSVANIDSYALIDQARQQVAERKLQKLSQG